MEQGHGDRNSASSKAARANQSHSGGFQFLFQTLATWDNQFHSRLTTTVGAIIEAIQFCAFAIGPVYAYNQPVVYEFTVAVFAFLVPIWDRNYGSFTYANYIIPVAILLGLLLVAGGVFISFVTKLVEQTDPLLTQGSRIILESMATWLFLPAMHIFMGSVMCNGSALHNFPDEKCWSTQHLATALVSAAGIVLTFVLGITMATTLSDSSPQSTHLRARAHNYIELLVFIVKTALVILFHLLVESGSAGAFSIALVVASIALLAAHVVVLPFYDSTMTRLRCITYSVTAFAATINCISSYTGLWFVTHRLNSFALAGLLPLAVICGYILHDIRPSTELLHNLYSLLHLAAVPSHKARFPFKRGSMSHDQKLAPLKFRSLEEDLLQEFSSTQQPGGEDDVDPTWMELVADSTEVLVPYVNSVVIPTDAEVATRFIEMHKRVTNLAVSGNALAFALRIYLKSILMFPRSGVTRFHFALFLFAYANKLNLALEVLLEVQSQVHDEHDILVHYSAHKYILKIRQLFGARDETHVYAFKRARQLHKEALSTMSLFWSKLMESKGDLVTPALLTNQITAKRQRARVEYERALAGDANNDRLLLSTYASFLEQVMCDTTAADQFRQFAEDAAEEKRQRIMRGSKSKSNFVDRKALEAKLTAEAAGDDDDLEAAAGFQSSNMTAIVTAVFVLVVLCSIGLCALNVASLYVDVDHVHALSNIGVARRAAAESELFMLLAASECQDASSCGVRYLGNLSKSETDFRIAHNTITYGTYGAKYGTLTYQRLVQETEVHPVPPSGGAYAGEYSILGNPSSRTFSSFEQDVGEVVQMESLWLVAQKMSMYLADFVNSVASKQSYRSVMLSVNSDFTNLLAVSYSSLSSVRLSQMKQEGSQGLAGTIVMFAAAIILLFICYVLFSFSLQDMALSKTNVLKLFTLIPYPTQEMLCTQAKTRLETFEKTHAEHDEETNEIDDAIDNDEDDQQEAADRKKKKSIISFSANKHTIAFDDADDTRKMSRFFGKTRRTSVPSTSHGSHPTILKKSAIKNTKRRVKFNIDGEQTQASEKKKKLAEPKVNIESSANIVDDFEKSMLQIEKEVLADQTREKQKREMETEKMVRGEIQSEKAVIRKNIASVGRVELNEEHKKDEVAVAEAHNKQLLMIAKIIMAVVVMMTLALMIYVYVTSSSFSSQQHDLLTREQDVIKFTEMVEHQVTLANYFSAFGTSSSSVASEYYNKFVASVVQNQDYLNLRNAYSTGNEGTDAAFNHYVELLTKKAESIVSLCLKVMAQAARGNGNIMTTIPLLATFADVADNCSLTDFSNKYDGCVEFPSEFVFPSLDQLVATQQPDQVLLSSLRQASSFRRRQLLNELRQLSNTTVAYLRDSYATTISAAASIQTSITAVALAVTAFSALFYFVRAVIMFGDERERAIKITLVIARFATVATLAIALDKSVKNADILGTYQSAVDAYNSTRIAYFDRHNDYALRYAVQGDDLSLLLTSDALSLESSIVPFLSSALVKVGIAAAPVVAFQSQAQTVRRLQQISAYLSYAAFAKINMVFPFFPRNDPRFVSSYNYALEPNSASDSVQYASDPNVQFMYSSSTNDISNNSTMLMSMSRYAIFGRRGYDYYTDAYSTLTDSVGSVVYATASAKVDSNKSDFIYYMIISIALSAYGSLCAVTIASLPIVDYIIHARAASIHADGMARAIFARAKTMCNIALSILCVVISVQFIIIMLDEGVGKEAADITGNARIREFVVTKTLTTAFNVNNSAMMDSALELAINIAAINSLYSQLNDIRNQLYFAPSSASFGHVPSLSSAQQSITFGSTNSLDVQYLQWRSWVASIANLVPSVSLSASGPLSSAGDVYVVSSSVKAVVSSTLSQMLTAYPALTEVLRTSSAQYESDASAAVVGAVPAHIILCAAVVIIALIELRFVFFAVSEELEEEEIGTRLTLNMIPPNVRDLVPKIPLYLETGVLVEESDEQAVYERSPHFLDFISTWSKDAPMDECFDNLNKSTTQHGYIVINATGIVQYQHANIIKMLGHEDLVGKNISVLLEEPLKSLHDGFLRRFVQQGTSRIVGMGRDVVGFSKSNTRVHMYLFLDVAVRSNGDVYFIGQLEPYDIEKCKDRKE